MKVGALAEAVTVKGESPVVDTTIGRRRRSTSTALLETTPGGQDIWNDHRVQGAGRRRRVARRRRQPGRAAALAVRARHAERAEHADAERRQRERPAAQGFAMYYYVPTHASTTSRSRPARRTSPSAPAACSSTWSPRAARNRFSGHGAADLPGQGDAVGQRRHRSAHAGLRPDANSTELTHQHQRARSAGRSSRTSCSTSRR